MARAAFFFGSGISLASGAPSVGTITDQLLGRQWIEHTDGTFFPNPPHYGGEPRGALRAQQFLQRIRDKIESGLLAREKRRAHYEDLFSAARQIVQDEMLEIPNPLIADFSAALRAQTADLFAAQPAHIDDNRFASLADRASILIQWAVAFGLHGAKIPRGMSLIGEVAKSVDDLDIFSLNHDQLIETQLNQDSVEFFDGFGNRNGDALIFDSNWPTVPAVRLFKLHGSIDWYRIRFSEWDQYAKLRSSVLDARDKEGRLINLLDVTPMFLSGNMVKEQVYGYGLIGEHFVRFRDRLSTHRTLICCGYGWGDKGINSRLIQWLHDAKENRVVILHGEGEAAVAAAGFWTFRWQRFRELGKVVVIPKWLSACTLAELKPYFSS
jgi:hypothetical protein